MDREQASVNTPRKTDRPLGRKRGVVQRVLLDKGFAFIRDADGAEYFAHATAFPPPEGLLNVRGVRNVGNGESATEVEFDAVSTVKGLRALRITVMTDQHGPELDDSAF